MTTQEAQWMTASYIFAVVMVTIAYDVWVVNKYGPNASISRLCGMAFHAYPLTFVWVLIGIGLFIGHCKLPAW